MSTSSNPANVNIRVKVTRNVNRQVHIDSTHAIPPVQEVVDQLPRQARRLVDRFGVYSYTTLEGIMTNCGTNVSVAVWQQAIAHAIARHVQEAAAPAMEMVVHTAPAYFVAGNAIYKLQAAEWRDSAKVSLLSAVRRRIMADAEEQKARIITAAEGQAERTRIAARHDANAIQVTTANARAELARLRQEMVNLWRPPTWITNNAIPIILIRGGGCKVFMPLHLKINRFVWSYQNPANENRVEVRVWKGRSRRATTIPCWLTLQMDGSYDQTAVHPDATVDGLLPHMDSYHTCQRLADDPTILNSWDDYNTLNISLDRSMSEVNLNSLLTSYDSWHVAAKRAVPEALKLGLRGEGVPWENIVPDSVEQEQETFYSAAPTTTTTIAAEQEEPE